MKSGAKCFEKLLLWMNRVMVCCDVEVNQMNLLKGFTSCW